jgi:hypothetical protein
MLDWSENLESSPPQPIVRPSISQPVLEDKQQFLTLLH